MYLKNGFFFFLKWLTPGGKRSLKDRTATYRSAGAAHPPLLLEASRGAVRAFSRLMKAPLGPEEMQNGGWLAQSLQKRWRTRLRLICVSVSVVFSDAGVPVCMCVSACVSVYVCIRVYVCVNVVCMYVHGYV